MAGAVDHTMAQEDKPELLAVRAVVDLGTTLVQQQEEPGPEVRGMPAGLVRAELHMPVEVVEGRLRWERMGQVQVTVVRARRAQ